ncbi:hypothetical protein N7478_008304 [Penicillium angulare]|uniref:uncharacterized protein n=1 Tax=Penicillium angulare TaxID=116970 RepID=UPI002540990A|nr:uncharacterized protein N7478_008304 [Penicillium angulare]KAJ5273179.1 hypothetical protein N7478_008304 [Penicillium angulare]
MNSLAGKVTTGQKTLRSACDLCHQGKVKCGGGTPCEGCDKLGVRCIYSTSNRTGRPKGVKNKKTLERIKQLRAANFEDNEDENSQCVRVLEESLSNAPVSIFTNLCRKITSVQNNRRPSAAKSGDEAGESSPAKPFSQSSNLTDQDDTPSHLWSFLSMRDAGQSESDFTPFDSSISDPTASPTSLPSNYLDMSNYTPPDISWIDSLLAAPDATPQYSDLSDIQKSAKLADPINSGCVPEQVSVNYSTPGSLPPFACNCVKKLADQLSKFKTLSHSRHLLQPDFVLTIARDALVDWQMHLSCQSCHISYDKDVLVLSVMTLRALLNLIKTAGQQSAPSDAELRPPIQDPSSPDFNPDYTFLGTYRLAREEKRLVVDLLLQRTLKSLNHMTEQLRLKSLRIAGTVSKKGSMSSHSSRSQSSISTPSASTSIFPDLEDRIIVNEQTQSFNITADTMMLDEDDNYLQESLQNSMMTIEALMAKTHIPHLNYDLKDSELITSRK